MPGSKDQQVQERAERSSLAEGRAHPPSVPQMGAAAQKWKSDRGQYLGDREDLEHRSVLRGLILLAVLVLGISLLRAGYERAFFRGWWLQW